jgi:hypothetical protein
MLNMSDSIQFQTKKNVPAISKNMINCLWRFDTVLFAKAAQRSAVAWRLLRPGFRPPNDTFAYFVSSFEGIFSVVLLAICVTKMKIPA